MKTKYKYVYFKLSSTSNKRNTWLCYDRFKDIKIGTISFSSFRNEYFILPVIDIDFSSSQLAVITGFINQLNRQ